MHFGFLPRLLPIIFVCNLGQANPSCSDATCSTETVAYLENRSNSLPPNLGVAATRDVPEFCRINGFRDAENLNLVSQNGFNVWSSNFIAAGEHREKIFDQLMTPEAVDSVRNLQDLTESQKDSCRKDIKLFKTQPMNQAKRLEATLSQASYFCSDVTYLNVIGCAKSVQKIVKIANPVSDITLHDIWEQVLTDPLYIRIMKQVGLKNLDLIRKNEVPQTRFFDDLHSAFNDVLRNSKIADDYTFNLLGVLSSGGTSTHNFIPWLKAPQGLKNAIFLLNFGSAVLDRRTADQKSGFLYSFPKEVESLCDYGKNYHFWMSAFLAREAVKASKNITAAAAASFTVGKGYQFMKEGSGRDPTKAFREDTFSNYNNNMRLDLAQVSAGALYGAKSLNPANRKVLSREKFENGLRKIFQGSIVLRRDPNFQFPFDDEEVELAFIYKKWKKTMNPNAAFEFFQKEM